MARCKGCGAEIDFVLMTTGKAMPVDAGYIMVNRKSKRSDTTIITDEGKTVRGRAIARGNHLKGYKPNDYFVVGRVSHFATCPAASEYRKAK